MDPVLSREIRALEVLADQLIGSQSLPTALQGVVDGVARWSRADRVVLVQYDGETREVRHSLRTGPGWAEGGSIGLDDLLTSLGGLALQTGQVILSPSSQARGGEAGCGAVLVVPLGSSPRWLGTITLVRRVDDPDFTTEDASGLERLAQAASWLLRLALERDRAAQATSEVQAAVRSKTHFLSNLSHELRTPLNGILGFSHLLEASSLDDGQRAMLQTILQSGQRLLGTIDNLLELAQFETGQFHLESAPFSPRAVLDSVIAKHRDLAAEKGLEWKVSADPDLPVVLEGDAVRIGQAWNHILANAVKFTERGSLSVHLETRRTARGRGELVLNVVDTGVGFSNERTGQWFTPFQQEDGSLTRKFGGTGLGLALCDRIVRQMGGGLSLLGEPGVGTKVRVWVDVSPKARLGRVAHHSLRVLLQEPDENTGLILGNQLERAGHSVDHVATLEEARAHLALGFYEVLLTQAPSTNPGLLSALKAESPDRGLHLIGLAEGGNPDAEVPWSTILHKPVSDTALLAALKPYRPWEDA